MQELRDRIAKLEAENVELRRLLRQAEDPKAARRTYMREYMARRRSR